MSGVDGVADYRFVIGRSEHVDSLRCELVPADSVAADDLVAEVGRKVREGLRFRADVVVVDMLSDGEGVLVDRRDWA